MDTTPTFYLEELEDYRVFGMITALFIVLMFLSIYINCRFIAIMKRRFRAEFKETYYPMLVLINFLSTLCLLILLFGCVLPWIPYTELNLHVLTIPFIYALVTPTEIAAADFILCLMRLYLWKKQSTGPIFKWSGIIVFIIISPLLGFISFFAQVFTVNGKNYITNRNLFAAFLIDNTIKLVFSLGSFSGYCFIYWKTRKRLNEDSIIRQAFPIASFQLFVIVVQSLLEMPFVPQFDARERFFLDICFSAACSIVVPLCTMIGETKKREMLYSAMCCFFCYLTPRPPAPGCLEGASRADRQKTEEDHAIREREKERRRKEEERRNGEEMENRAFCYLEEIKRIEEESVV